jgi:hypothetical protein
VGAERAHFVVNAFGYASRFVFDAVERVGMGDYFDLPSAFGWRGEERRGAVYGAAGIEGAWGIAVGRFALAGYNPTLGDGISANFHFYESSNGK